MTVTVEEAASGPYYPNGVTTQFPFDFKAAAGDEIAVVLVSDDGTFEAFPDGSFSVVLAVDNEGGTVTMGAAPVNDGRALFVVSSPSFAQEILFEDEGPFNSAILNPVADRSAIRDIWLRDQVLRSIRVPFGEVGPLLPRAAARAGKVLSFDGDGNPIALTVGSAQLALQAQRREVVAVAGQTQFAFAAAALPGFVSVFVNGVKLPASDFLLNGALVTMADACADGDLITIEGFASSIALSATLTSYAGRTVAERLDEALSVMDKGARGNGVNDDTAAIQAAIDAVFARGGGTVFLPRGDFRILGTLTGRVGVSIQGQGSLASRLLKIGAGDCIVYGTGTGGGDADIERVTLSGFSIIGQAASGKLFWGRKTTTAFALRDMYIEGGNSPVVLDSAYSLVMDNVQVRAAETGDNITLNAISHNVTLIQVASQVAKAGAGISMIGCYTVLIVGGKLEFNQRDQLRIGQGGGCRGVSIVGLYIEGIQPTASGYAGINAYDVDGLFIYGGFYDATQNGPMGTNGTGTYFKTSGATSRMRCDGYGFAAIGASQTHVAIGAAAYGCDIRVPLGATFTNAAPGSNFVRYGTGEEAPLHVSSTAGQAIAHNATATLAFATEIKDIRDEWTGGNTFSPKNTDYYNVAGFVQLAGVAGVSQANAILWNATDNVLVAQVVRYVGAGAPTVDFNFREPLTAGKNYQLRLYYSDSAATARALSASAESNRVSIERVK